ncbi:peroxisomal biogenesis factor 19-like [Babylonia areolata]|uniref:peroxisomal biogenesis factor 19-like n=1 Tax=Babylonia areolata TaxID=304850 RepID=UPI003FD24F1E
MADQSASQPSSVETSVDDGREIAINSDVDAMAKYSQDDPELNELLNSALEDFDKVKLSETSPDAPTGATAQPPADGGAAGGKPQGAEPDPMSAEFTEMFSEQFASHFEETMASMMSQNPQVIQQFEKLAQAANTAGDSPEAQKNFMDTLTQTLMDMSQNADGIQEETVESEGQAEGQGEDFMPMMQELMQTLLSKNVLYPSLKEIASKYPAYLSENEGKVDASDLELYRKQYDLMTAICSVYEEETGVDSAEVKTQRFEKLLDLMQKMQDLGQPPKDIVGDMAPGLEFDEHGMPKLPGMDSSQCCLM